MSRSRRSTSPPMTSPWSTSASAPRSSACSPSRSPPGARRCRMPSRKKCASTRTASRSASPQSDRLTAGADRSQQTVQHPRRSHPRHADAAGQDLPRHAQPGGRRPGQHPAHAQRLLRADLLHHLPQRAGAGLPEDHQPGLARGADEGRGIHQPGLPAPDHLRGGAAAASRCSATRPPTAC